MGTDILLRLRAAGCVFAEDEARLLRGTAQSEEHLHELVERRIAGEPLEHILGFVEFCGSTYQLGPGVFIPRQRSTFLVEVAAQYGGDLILDLCCGCGALGMSVLGRVAGRVIGTDISPEAVAYAQVNGVHETYVGDLFDALPPSYRGRVNTLIANTPYVPSDSVHDMPRESRDYEPRSTVDGGPDGMDLQRRVLAGAAAWLAPAGVLVTETSTAQAPALLMIAEECGWRARIMRDGGRGATVLLAEPQSLARYPQRSQTSAIHRAHKSV